MSNQKPVRVIKKIKILEISIDKEVFIFAEGVDNQIIAGTSTTKGGSDGKTHPPAEPF